MAYFVKLQGQVQLPADTEARALKALLKDVTARPGPVAKDDPSVTMIADLGEQLGLFISRQGDQLVLSPDSSRLGDSVVWTDQTTAFFHGLGKWVSDGEVHLSGEDDARWLYRYSVGQLSQVGRNGYDNTGHGQSAPPTPPPSRTSGVPQTKDLGPATGSGSHPIPDSGPDEAQAPPRPPSSRDSSGSHVDFTGLPESFFDDPEPQQSPARTALMVGLLLFGVFMIVALGLVFSGL